VPETDVVTTAEIRRDSAAKQQAIRHLWQLDRTPGGRRQPNLYAILDAARDEQIYPGLRRLAATEEILCLYQGQAAMELASVAPYLVCLGSSNRVFDWLWEHGWGENWGVFHWSQVSPRTLREHFRRLTLIRTENGARLLFRFYDPRVLREFLPTCDREQLRDMFGPIHAFMAESDDGGSVVTFRNPLGLLQSINNPLRPPKTPEAEVAEI
jgi:hypothetical protein